MCPRCGASVPPPDTIAAGPQPPPLVSIPGAVPRIAKAPTSGIAVFSLILGIVSYVCLGPLASVPGLILGIVALNRIRRERPALGGEGAAIAGIILSGINMALCVVLIPIMAAISLPALARAREAARRASCQNNLKQMGLVLKMFANDNKGAYFPVLSPEPGKLMFANKSAASSSPLYPEYMSDLHVMICPSDDEADKLETESSNPDVMLDDHSYFYLGYAMTSEQDMDRFAEAYRKATAEHADFEQDFDTETGGNRVLRLREGIERFFITDIQNPVAGVEASASIPLLIERPGNHVPFGGNVLFMDGHVEFIRFGTKWPMTDRAIGILQALDGGYWPPKPVSLR
jgi:prepilin-type processing-associated H-X9-DG protein